MKSAAIAPPAPAGTAPLVSLRGVGMHFGRKVALRDVDLEVDGGAFVAVIGADGAGKSTLLRVLAGLRPPSGGEVMRTVPKDQVGFSGAEFDLYGDLTVMENLRFFASVRGMTGTEFRQAAADILEMVGLTEATDRLGAALSGGMKKKLGLAAALIYRPRLLILDEPTVGVDPTSRRELWGIVARAHAGGTAVVFSTTYLDEAERAGRVVLLTDGQTTELPPEQMEEMASGWQAWVLPGEARRNDVRTALARAGLDARAYLREEGLALLAPGREEAQELAGRVLACLPSESGGYSESPAPELRQAALSLDDLFVLVQMGLVDRAKVGA